MNTLSSLLKNLRNRSPVGSMEMYAGSTAPTDWLICDGSAVSRETFSSLFAVIGTTYGAGDGTSTFNLPDMRDRVPVGAGASYALNASGGTNSISYTPAGTVGGTTLTDANIAHGHGFTQPKIPNHVHSASSGLNFCEIRNVTGASGTFDVSVGAGGAGFASTRGYGDVAIPSATGNPTSLGSCTGGAVSNLHGASSSRTAHSHSLSGTAASLDVRQPYRGINFIIYAGKTA